MHVIVVPFTTVTPVAAVPPNVTVAPLTKPVPVIVTAVPPATAPVGGATEVTVGAGNFAEIFRILDVTWHEPEPPVA